MAGAGPGAETGSGYCLMRILNSGTAASVAMMTQLVGAAEPGAAAGAALTLTLTLTTTLTLTLTLSLSLSLTLRVTVRSARGLAQ
jgi:hypothetical protein